MTYEEKMAAIDSYFDSITAEQFNEILEHKYGIKPVDDNDDSSEEHHEIQ